MALTNATTLADYSSGIGTQGATLKVDANNQRVGIGTVTPAETLDVVGNMAVEGDISVTGTISYEDLTNVDAIGYSTFRSGVDIQGAGSTTTTLNVTGIATVGAGLSLADNVKAQFGTGGDLQIYHDGSHSYIRNEGTGNLYIDGDTDDLVLQAGDDVRIQTQGNENAINCIGDGAVEIYYNNSKKFETTGSGAIVTGIITATSFSGDGSGLSGVSGYNDLDNALFG